MLLFSLAILSMTIAASALFRDKKVVLTAGLWVLLLPVALFNLCVAWRLADMGDSPFSNWFPVSYVLP